MTRFVDRDKQEMSCILALVRSSVPSHLMLQVVN